MSGMAMKLCVVGHNISYSLSPRLHAAIFAALGEDGSYSVEDIAPCDLYDNMPRLLGEYDGFNVTKPHKESVARYLGHDGPVNTVRSDGECTSTDPMGFISDYTDAFGSPCGSILVLGAGGAAKSVAEALSGSGAKVYVYNRTYEKALQMEKFGAVAVVAAAGDYDAVVNCTSLGLGGEQAAPEELDFRGVKYAYDLVYSPPVTPFMSRAAESGAKVRGGIGMLVYQAIAAHEFLRKITFDCATRRKLYDAAIAAVK